MPISIADNLAAVREQIARAATAAGRNPADVTLIAVSKNQSAEAIREAVAAGQTVFGENRVQEALTKFKSMVDRNQLQLHLVGTLQTNKVRDALDIFDVIHSLDRGRLAAAIAAAGMRGRAFLVQVNTGDEPQKGGVPRVQADAFLTELSVRYGLRPAGLMCIPPADDDPAPHFAWLRELANSHGLGILSMGMSADYPTAIRLGATHVRIGTAIFGARR
jgi:hypothetical protein